MQRLWKIGSKLFESLRDLFDHSDRD
jgi:hypothetical protein